MHKPYLIINLILAGIIGCIFIYSGIFSVRKNNHPIPSFFEEITGEPSPSSGMSRAFSEIMRADIHSARNYNPDAPRIFAFFLIQFFQRITLSLIFIKWKRKNQWTGKKKHLLIADALFSGILFLYCFAGQIGALFRLLNK